MIVREANGGVRCDVCGRGVGPNLRGDVPSVRALDGHPCEDNVPGGWFVIGGRGQSVAWARLRSEAVAMAESLRFRGVSCTLEPNYRKGAR